MKFDNFIYLLAVLFLSCNEGVIDKTWERVKLPEIREVVIDSFDIEPINKFPMDIVRINKNLVVRNIMTDTIFRVFSLPDIKYVGWFGTIGKGPNEFLLAPLIREHSGLIQMSGVKKILLVDLPDTNIKNNFKIIEEYIIPGSIHPLNETFTLNDNRFYGIVFGGRLSDIQKRKELVFFNVKTYDTGSLIDFPNSLFGTLTNNNFLYPKLITVSPKNDKFAFCYMLYPLIRIFDKKSQIIKEIWIDGLPKQIKFKNVMSNASDDKISNILLGYGYYQKVISSEKYIYALYSNDKGIKTGKGKYSYGRKLISNPELHVFTWEGNSVLRISLRKGISSMELSEDERYIYSVDADIMDKIFRYDLKNVW
jgi:hypothetical protein